MKIYGSDYDLDKLKKYGNYLKKIK